MGWLIFIYISNQMQLGWRKGQQDQEQHLQQIHELTLRMKRAGKDIGMQLKRQQGLIQEFDGQMQATEGRLGDLQKQVGELLQTTDVSQVCSCLMLCCSMIILIILVIIL